MGSEVCGTFFDIIFGPGASKNHKSERIKQIDDNFVIVVPKSFSGAVRGFKDQHKQVVVEL